MSEVDDQDLSYTSGLTLSEAGRNFYISSLLLHNSLAQAT